MKILKALLRKAGELSPNCREAARLQSEALDHPLGLGQRIGLRIHLVLCKWCRRYGKQIGFLRSTAHRHEEHEQCFPPQTLPPEARERLKRRLQEEK
jgi:hypothetical protein